jgi:predicted metal-binding membrane protein
MWLVMMVAMMLPSAAPMLLLFAGTQRGRGSSSTLVAFAAGYVLVWGVFSVAAAALQAKNACLRRCQSPLGFLLGHWREGIRGALAMGVRHGAFCLGCCWALMTLLFVGGVMNLAWVAALAVFVLAEKALARGPWLSRVGGVALIGWAVWLVAHGARSG